MTALESLRVGRIDLVDEAGVTRMTLAAELPNPMISGVEYPRMAPVSGIMIRDDEGNERGGIGYMAGQGGRVITMLDHLSAEAVGSAVLGDGTVLFTMSQMPPDQQDGESSNTSPRRIHMQVSHDGTPQIALADAKERPRLRLTLRPDGAGAIEFLNAAGEVVQAIVPEHDPA